MENIISRAFRHFLRAVSSPVKTKERYALVHWKKRVKIEGVLHHEHFEYFFTEYFGLDRSFYSGKRILDIGCGPRGSLEWADMAEERVGLDPFAEAYLKLGAKEHNMRYVAAPAEKIPFPDGHFDIVSSFNSFDHVDNIDDTINEIARVIKPGGAFLLITDIRTYPTACEPQVFSWDITDKLRPFFDVSGERHYESCEKGVYESVLEGVEFDHSNNTERKGVLTGKFIRSSS